MSEIKDILVKHYNLHEVHSYIWGDVRRYKKLGIEVTLVDPDAPVEEIEKAFRPNTKALFGETISNPSVNVLDIEKFAELKGMI